MSRELRELELPEWGELQRGRVLRLLRLQRVPERRTEGVLPHLGVSLTSPPFSAAAPSPQSARA